MKLILTLIPDKRCLACSLIGWCNEKTLLCLRCEATRIEAESRKVRIANSTMTALKEKFTQVGMEIAKKLNDFNSPTKESR